MLRRLRSLVREKSTFEALPAALIPLLAVGDLMIFSNIGTSDPSGRQRLTVVGYWLLGYCILGFRWKATTAVFLGIWIHTTAAALFSMADAFLYVPFFGPMLALHAVAVRAERAVAVAALCASTVPAFMCVWVEVGTIEENQLSAFVGVNLFYLVFILGFWGVGRWGRARKAAAEQARAAAEQDRRRLADATAAIAAERRQFAHEMHDIVANSVTVMAIQAAGARKILHSSPDGVDEALGVIERRGGMAIEELRRLLAVMNADGEVPDGRSKCLADLDALLAEVNGTDFTIRKEVCGTPRAVPESVGLAAYRIVQEAITNITKHAGPGTTAVVRFGWSKALTIEVIDDGMGTPVKDPSELSTGHGLLGLEERVRMLGGTLQADSLDKGFRVAATIPISTPDDASPHLADRTFA
jgi:signal transduction histidine kinase